MASSHHRLTLKVLLALVTLATVDLRPCLAQSSVMPSQSVAAAASTDVSIVDPSSVLMPETTPEATTIPVMASETPSASPAPSPSLSPTPTPAPSPASSSSAPAPAPSSSEAVEASSSMLAAPPSSSSPELSSSAAMTTSETSSSQPSQTPTTEPPITGTTESTSSPDVLPMAAIIGIAAGGGLLLAVALCGLFICLCCCLRKSSRSATYDATRGRPVYVVRRWDERTEHVPNRGGSFRGSKGSFARSSIRSSISSIASMLRLSGRRSRNNSLSRSGMAETHTNPTIMKVTPI